MALLYLGRLSRWKGVHHAIHATSKLVGLKDGRDYKLTIAGAALFDEKDYETELKSLVQELGLEDHVNFLGHVADVRPILDEHDMLIHASTVPEPFGQVIVQAMGAGLSVVATRGGGPGEIITDGQDGVLYTPGDQDDLVSTILKVLDQDMIAQLSEQAIETSKEYTDDRIVASLDATLQSYRQNSADPV
ncbi:glycosyltransferase [Arthrobacter sp. 3Tela_A]